MVVVDGAPPGAEVHQFLCGRDIATGSDTVCQMASQMANYVYVVVDTRDESARSAVVVDACWDVDGLLRLCREDLGVQRVTAALYTHRHFDHTGGRLPRGMTGGRKVVVPGVHSFVEQGIAVGVGRDDVEAVAKQSGVEAGSLRALGEGESVPVGGEGGASLSVLCTPGHTTGSICLRLHNQEQADASPSVLFTGDTLFIGSCGRYDLPESDLRSLLASLERLSKLPPQTVVLPGHNYARPAHTTIGAERDANDMMIQAMGLVKSGRIAPSAVAASLPLPDYLGVAERLAASFAALAPGDGDECCKAGGCIHDDSDDEEWGHSHWPLPCLTGSEPQGLDHLARGRL